MEKGVKKDLIAFSILSNTKHTPIKQGNCPVTVQYQIQSAEH